jgi:hypothetical protein
VAKDNLRKGDFNNENREKGTIKVFVFFTVGKKIFLLLMTHKKKTATGILADCAVR